MQIYSYKRRVIYELTVECGGYKGNRKEKKKKKNNRIFDVWGCGRSAHVDTLWQKFMRRLFICLWNRMKYGMGLYRWDRAWAECWNYITHIYWKNNDVICARSAMRVGIHRFDRGSHKHTHTHACSHIVRNLQQVERPEECEISIQSNPNGNFVFTQARTKRLWSDQRAKDDRWSKNVGKTQTRYTFALRTEFIYIFYTWDYGITWFSQPKCLTASHAHT